MFSSPGQEQPFNQEMASMLFKRHLVLPAGTTEGISAAGLKDVATEDVGEKHYRIFQQRTVDLQCQLVTQAGKDEFQTDD